MEFDNNQSYKSDPDFKRKIGVQGQIIGGPLSNLQGQVQENQSNVNLSDLSSNSAKLSKENKVSVLIRNVHTH
jgi:hypothetical protein